MDPSQAQAVEGQVTLFNLIGGPLVNDDEVRQAATLAFERDFDRSGVDRQLAAVIASPDRTKSLGDIQAPALVIHGLVDSLVGYSGGIATAKAIPDARLLMFPNMGHDLPRSLWPEMIDAIIVNTQRNFSKTQQQQGAGNPMNDKLSLDLDQPDPDAVKMFGFSVWTYKMGEQVALTIHLG